MLRVTTFKLSKQGPQKLDIRSNFNPEMNENECGNYKFKSALIIGGERRSKRKYPWVAALLIDDEYTCTVNFISRTRAVTAAHCLAHEFEPEEISLYIFTDKCKFFPPLITRGLIQGIRRKFKKE